LALSDDSLDAAAGVEAADRALGLMKMNPELEPAAALDAAKQLPPK
jgi:hypothetical protein